jgi:hypothetical protein
MPEMIGLSLEEAKAKYPDLGAAVDCISGFMSLFADEGVGVIVGRSPDCFWVRSFRRSPDFDESDTMWEAWIYAERASVCWFKREGGAWFSQKGVRYTLDEFTNFLQRVRNHRRKKTHEC